MPQNLTEGAVNVDLHQRVEVPLALEYRSAIEYHNDVATGSPERFGPPVTGTGLTTSCAHIHRGPRLALVLGSQAAPSPAVLVP